MENFVPIVVMIIVFMAISAVANRIKASVEEAQRRMKETQRTVRREDLPEATRRQLYGDDVPPVRRARPVIVQAPPEYDGEGRNEGEGVNDEEPFEDEEANVPRAPAQPPRPRPVQTAEGWGEFRRRIEEGTRNFEMEARRRLEEAQRQAESRRQTEFQRQEEARRRQREAEQARQREAEQARREAARRRTSAPAPRRESPAPQKPGPEAARGLRPKPRPGHRRHPLLGDTGDIRRAIVMREILGPPKAFD